jgi:hypothetical protein
MGGELAVSLLRLGYLLILWLFVLFALLVLRRDVYGTTIMRRQAKQSRKSKRASRTQAPEARPLARVQAPLDLPPATPVGAYPPAPAPIAPPVRVSAQHPEAPTRLVVTNGPLRGTTLPLLATGVVMGRSALANLVLDDEYASGRHAQIVQQGGEWYLEDLGSTNGTYLGREKIAGPTLLRAGQTIRIGNTTVEVLR